MIRYSSDIIIDRPLAEVSAFALDPSTHVRWMGDVVSVEPLTSGDLAVGSRYRYGIRKGPMAVEVVSRVASLEPGRRIAYVTEPGGSLDWNASLTFEAIDSGRTRVTSEGEIGLRGLRRLIEPLMAGEVRSGEAAELVSLKKVLEAV